jgi:hypothetical protein
MRPYQPALAAAAIKSVPAVITPLPPLPASAMEMQCAAPASRRRDGEVAVRSGWWMRGSNVAPFLPMPTVNRQGARLRLIEINARALAAAHDDFRQKRYYGTVIPK